MRYCGSAPVASASTWLGFDASHVDALATGAEPQYRVIKNAPKDVSREDLRELFGAAMRYW